MDSLADAGGACMVYVTIGSEAEAKSIAKALVKESLIACANVLGPASSIYMWEDEVQEAQEFVLICKTQRMRLEAAAARVRELHSYDTPCITVYEMAAGFPPYVEWIFAETKPR